MREYIVTDEGGENRRAYPDRPVCGCAWANDEEDAAAQWAAAADADNVECLDERTAIVTSPDGTVERYTVTLTMEPVYSARREGGPMIPVNGRLLPLRRRLTSHAQLRRRIRLHGTVDTPAETAARDIALQRLVADAILDAFAHLEWEARRDGLLPRRPRTRRERKAERAARLRYRAPESDSTEIPF